MSCARRHRNRRGRPTAGPAPPRQQLPLGQVQRVGVAETAVAAVEEELRAHGGRRRSEAS